MSSWLGAGGRTANQSRCITQEQSTFQSTARPNQQYGRNRKQRPYLQQQQQQQAPRSCLHQQESSDLLLLLQRAAPVQQPDRLQTHSAQLAQVNSSAAVLTVPYAGAQCDQAADSSSSSNSGRAAETSSSGSSSCGEAGAQWVSDTASGARRLDTLGHNQQQQQQQQQLLAESPAWDVSIPCGMQAVQTVQDARVQQQVVQWQQKQNEPSAQNPFQRQRVQRRSLDSHGGAQQLQQQQYKQHHPGHSSHQVVQQNEQQLPHPVNHQHSGRSQRQQQQQQWSPHQQHQQHQQQGPGLSDAELLAQQLPSCKTVPQLLGLLAAHARDCDAVAVSAAVLCYAKLLTPEGAGLLQQQDAAAAAAGGGGGGDSRGIDAAAAAAVQGRSAALHSQQQMLWQQQQEQQGAAAADSGSSNSTRLPPLLRQLLLLHLPAYRPRQYANTLYALGRMHCRDKPLVDLLLQGLNPALMGYLKPQEIANVAWALGRLRVWPKQQWLDTFYKVSAKQLRAQLQHQGLPVQHQQQQQQREAGPGVQQQQQQQGALSSSQQQQQRRRQGHLRLWKPQELANLVWGLGRLHVVPPLHWWQAVLPLLQQQLHNFTPQQLSNIVWGLAHIRGPRRAVKQSCADSTSSSSSSSSNVVGAAVPGGFLQAVAAVALPQLTAFDSQELSCLLWGLDTLHEQQQQYLQHKQQRQQQQQQQDGGVLWVSRAGQWQEDANVQPRVAGGDCQHPAAAAAAVVVNGTDDEAVTSSSSSGGGGDGSLGASKKLVQLAENACYPPAGLPCPDVLSVGQDSALANGRCSQHNSSISGKSAHAPSDTDEAGKVNYDSDYQQRLLLQQQQQQQVWRAREGVVDSGASVRLAGPTNDSRGSWSSSGSKLTTSSRSSSGSGDGDSQASKLVHPTKLVRLLRAYKRLTAAAWNNGQDALSGSSQQQQQQQRLPQYLLQQLAMLLLTGQPVRVAARHPLRSHNSSSSSNNHSNGHRHISLDSSKSSTFGRPSSSSSNSSAQLRSWDAKEASSLCTALLLLTQLGLRPNRQYLTTVLEAIHEQQYTMRAADFGAVASALQDLGYMPGKPWVVSFLQAAQQQFDGITPEAAAVLLVWASQADAYFQKAAAAGGKGVGAASGAEAGSSSSSSSSSSSGGSVDSMISSAGSSNGNGVLPNGWVSQLVFEMRRKVHVREVWSVRLGHSLLSPLQQQQQQEQGVESVAGAAVGVPSLGAEGGPAAGTSSSSSGGSCSGVHRQRAARHAPFLCCDAELEQWLKRQLGSER